MAKKTPAQLDAEIAEALRAPRVVNRAKLEALLRYHVNNTAVWQQEASNWKASSHPEAADEARHAREYAIEHQRLAKRIATAAIQTPAKLVELSRLGEAPEELHLSEEDIWGPDD